MKYEHVFEIRVKGSQLSSINTVLKSVNTNMKDLGFDEEIDLEMTIGTVSLKADTKFNQEQILKATTILSAQLKKHAHEVSRVVFKETKII